MFHVDEIFKIYKKLLNLKESNIFDVGTGKGIKIRDIVKNLNLPNKNVKFVKRKNFEIDNSIANNSDLIKKIKLKKFKILEKFMKTRKLNYQNNKIKPNYLEKNSLWINYLWRRLFQAKNCIGNFINMIKILYLILLTMIQKN